MTVKQHFTTEQAREIGDKLGIDWSRINVEQFRMGLDVELEHGLHDPSTDVTGNDPILTGKIALAHLNEFADYYTRLEKMEAEAKEGHRALTTAAPERGEGGASPVLSPQTTPEAKDEWRNEGNPN